MGYNGRTSMKRVVILIALLIACGSFLYAQERTKIADGLYMVRYGNVSVLEDNIHQCTIQLKVEQSSQTDSYGQQLYDLFCGNEYTKNIAKTSLKYAIASIITKVATEIGAATGGVAGGVAGASVGGYISQYATTIASKAYDDACNYYSDTYGR